MSKEYLGLPRSVEQTIKNMKELKRHLIEKVKAEDFEGKGEEDAKEIEFDFTRVENALLKSKPRKVEIKAVETNTGKSDEIPLLCCPTCGKQTILTCAYCTRCGQKLIFPSYAYWKPAPEECITNAILPVTEAMSQAFGENWPKPNFPLKSYAHTGERK